MKYNLTQYAQTTSTGTMLLTTDQIITITSSGTNGVEIPVEGTYSGTIALESDLGIRVHVDEVQYYFDSPEPISTIASGIKFSYKNESFEVYVSLNTYYNNDYYYTIVSGTDAPRYIKVEHTVVSGTTGYLNAFKVLNDEDYVDFGQTGTQTSTNFNLSVENNLSDINELKVFNSGPAKANARIVIEPQYTVADNLLLISDSYEGPWYGLYREDDKIAGTDIWDTGIHNDTRIVTDKLVLSSGKTSGTYTTRIVNLDELQRLNRIVTPRNYPVVVPETSFFDDFSQGNLNWTILQASSVDITFNEFLDIEDNYGGTDRGIVETTNEIDYGDDWMMTYKFRFAYNYYGPTSNALVVTFSDGFAIQMSIGDDKFGTWNDNDVFRLFIDDVEAFNWWDLYGDNWARVKIDTWFYFKIQREFQNFRVKFWEVGDPEPDWISTKILDNSTDIEETGKFKIDSSGMSGSPNTSLDDLLVIKHYTSAADDKSIIATDDIDTYENVEVRSSNSKPLDRLTTLELSLQGPQQNFTKHTQHEWVADGTVAEISDSWANWSGVLSGNYWEFWFDSITETTVVVDKQFATGYDTEVAFKLIKKDGTVNALKIYDADYDVYCYYNTYKITLDTTGGFWIYFFLAASDINTGQYYLRYYNSSLGEVYNRQATSAQGTFLYDMDSVYGTAGDLWYTDRDLSTVFKIDTAGNILASYLATEGIRGLFALDDGGCWFIQDQALTRLDSSAVRVDLIDLNTSNASYVYSDNEGGFWLQDGWNIRHLDPTGTEIFSVEIPNLYWITVVDSGVITKQHDGSTSTFPQASYVNKDYKRVMRTWDYPNTEGAYKGSFDYNRYGVRSHTFDDLTDDHASNFPIAIDSAWTTDAEWKKASLRDYNLSNEEYHQVRATLRAKTSIQSPVVGGIYTQRAIEIPDIYPGNRGTFYLKSDVTNLAAEDIGNYTSNVRAYWLLDSE